MKPIDSNESESGNKTEKISDLKDWYQGEKITCNRLSDERLVIGENIGAVNEIPRIAKQPNKNSHRSDWISDIAQLDDTKIMATSMRGSLHYGFETVRQDTYAIGSESDQSGDKWLIVAIADGVSASPRAHAIADYMVRQTVLVVADALQTGKMIFKKEYWENISKKLVEISVEYCKTATRGRIQLNQNIDVDTIDIDTFAREWAATLEYIVIQTKKTLGSQTRKFVHISVAGDGSAYILNENKGWYIVKSGKQRNSEILSNAVSPLPLTPKAYSIKFGELSLDDCLVMVTDGLGDFIGSGNTPIGGFFQKAFPKCESLIQFLHYSSVALRQADDDRTIILIK